DGEDVRVTALRDVSRRKAAERQLRFQADVLAQVTDAVIALTLDGRVTYWNGGAERLHGIPAEEALGRKLSDVVAYTVPGPADDVRRVESPSPHARPLVEAGDLFLDGLDGRRVVAASSSVLYDEHGDEAGLLAVVRDVTAQREAEGNLQYRATHDSLTGLANRVQFREKIAEALTAAGKRRADDAAAACDVAVLFVDLDGFKDVNDSLGHEAGDRLLVELAARMSGVLRGADEGRPSDVLARLGGDEFGVLLHCIDESTARGVADRLLAAVAAPLMLDGHRVSPGASVGLAAAHPAYAAAPDPAGALLRDADTAMYAAKQTGRGRVVPFTPAMHDAADERFRLGEDLRGAAARGELRVRYQPIVELTTGRLTGLEALVRWAHPEHGLLTPDRFIPLAESLSLLAEIDRWVLAESCRELGSWGADAYHLRLGVNCSEATYLDPAFPAYVAEMLRTHVIVPERLLLELTERALVEDPALTQQALHALHAQNVRIGIDDFGTGTSSLALLHTLPIDVLKVDRSFVAAMEASPRSHAVVRTIVGLAHDLDMGVIAEGVETASQAAALWRLGCPHGQGYLYARPLEAADARALLDAPAWPSAAR
ncbi:MAG TPA: EAL domain-containing protein, partial [Rhodothermales bacterium]|nr:EAL domain-containing protein [Rhodothermales bacterium]